MADSKCYWEGGTDGDYTDATNWSGVTPVSTDSVRIPKSATQQIDENLDQSAVDLKDFLVEKDCSVQIGNFSVTAQLEYLKILLKSTTYWDATLRGSGESYLHFTNYRNIFVEEAPAASNGNFGLNLQGLMDGTGAGKVFITAESGTVGLAANNPEEVFEAEEINITGANVVLGEGVVDPDGASALPLLNVMGGTVVSRCAITAANITDSTYRHEGGAVGTLTVNSGTAVIAGENTEGVLITAAEVRTGATLDMTGDLKPKTITNVYLASGATLDIRGGHVTLSNPINLDGCAVQDVTVLADAEATVQFT